MANLKYHGEFQHCMAKLVEMDERVTVSKQLEENIGPVILMNKFNVKVEEVDQFKKAWAEDALHMKTQPGFISAQLHQGIAGSGVFFNYAVWESATALRKALSNFDLKESIAHYGAGTVLSPHIFKKVAVPGICVD